MNGKFSAARDYLIFVGLTASLVCVVISIVKSNAKPVAGDNISKLSTGH